MITTIGLLLYLSVGFYITSKVLNFAERNYSEDTKIKNNPDILNGFLFIILGIFWLPLTILAGLGYIGGLLIKYNPFMK